MSEAKLLRFDQIAWVDRGGGIYTNPLIAEATGAKVFCSGITSFPAGAAVALHSHNTDEQVTLLEGEATAEIEGHQEDVVPYDTTFIPAGVPHRFINRGAGGMRIMWVYGSVHVTRTYVETGEVTGQFGPLSSHSATLEADPVAKPSTRPDPNHQRGGENGETRQ